MRVSNDDDDVDSFPNTNKHYTKVANYGRKMIDWIFY